MMDVRMSVSVLKKNEEGKERYGNCNICGAFDNGCENKLIMGLKIICFRYIPDGKEKGRSFTMTIIRVEQSRN